MEERKRKSPYPLERKVPLLLTHKHRLPMLRDASRNLLPLEDRHARVPCLELCSRSVEALSSTARTFVLPLKAILRLQLGMLCALCHRYISLVIADYLRSQEAARGAGLIMDQCSRGDGTVMGENHAWASRCLLIHILGE